MNNRTSIRTLQNQCAYEQNVDIRQGEKLTGGFGKTIYKAEWIKQKGSPIVVLEMQGNQAIEELFFYISLSHPHIIKTFGLVKPNTEGIHSDSILLLQEYASNGDLNRLLTEQYFIPSQLVLLEIFIQISDAMRYLTEVNVIHGDLACRNVLVFESHPDDPKRNLVKLIDFGLTRNKLISLDVKIDIPVRYAAPEILRSNGRTGYSEKSDAFSFGVLIWEAFSPDKRMPYEQISDDHEVRRRKLNGENLPQPEKCDTTTWKLMLKCWNNKPEDRPTFQMIHQQLKNQQNLNVLSTSLDSISSFPHYHSGLNICDAHKRNCVNNPRRHPTNVLFRRPPMPSRGNCSRRKNDRISSLSQSNHETIFNSNTKIYDSSHSPLIKTRKPVISSTYRSDSDIQLLHIRHISTSNESVDHRSFGERSSYIQLNITQMPCEFCKNLINASQLIVHQSQCEENSRHTRISKELDLLKIECKFCNQKCSIMELDNHQDNCTLNPKMSFYEQSKSSPSIPDIIIGKNSTTNLSQQNSTPKTNVKPSLFRRFILRLSSFWKKK